MKPFLFIASLKPASLEVNTSNLPIQKISNMFNDQGPIPNIDNKILFERLNAHLNTSPYVAGEALSIADITGYEVVQLAIAIEMNFDEFEEVKAWLEKLDKRFKLDE